MEKIIIKSLDEVKITKMKDYVIHFRVGEESYIYHDIAGYYDRHQIRRKVKGSRTTIRMKAIYGEFVKPKDLRIHPSQPYSDKRLVEAFVKALERNEFAETPLKNLVSQEKRAEIKLEIKVLEERIQELKNKINEL